MYNINYIVLFLFENVSIFVIHVRHNAAAKVHQSTPLVSLNQKIKTTVRRTHHMAHMRASISLMGH